MSPPIAEVSVTTDLSISAALGAGVPARRRCSLTRIMLLPSFMRFSTTSITVTASPAADPVPSLAGSDSAVPWSPAAWAIGVTASTTALRSPPVTTNR